MNVIAVSSTEIMCQQQNNCTNNCEGEQRRGSMLAWLFLPKIKSSVALSGTRAVNILTFIADLSA